MSAHRPESSTFSKKELFKEFLRCFSLAALLVSYEIKMVVHKQSCYLNGYRSADVLAFILLLFGISLAFFIGRFVWLSSSSKALKKTGVVIFALILFALFNLFFSSAVRYHKTFELAVRNYLIILLGLITLCWFLRKYLGRILKLFLLLISPWALYNLGHLAYCAAVFTAPAAQPALAHHKAKQRVVLFILDEWDYSITFENPSIYADLPHIRALQKELISFDHLYPAGPLTVVALPSLLIGEEVHNEGKKSSQKFSRSDMAICYRNSNEWGSFAKSENLFRDNFNKGYRQGLIGFYHPYQRIFPSFFQKVPTNDGGFTWVFPSSGFPLPIHFTPTFKSVRHTPWKRDLCRKNEIEGSAQGDEIAIAYASDAELDFVFIHLPKPHFPVSEPDLDPFSYRSCLIGLDRFLGKLQEGMKRSKTWDNSVIILTTDHWLRYNLIKKNGFPFTAKEVDPPIKPNKDHRIPMLVKLIGQAEPTVISTETNTFFIRSLVGKLLGGDIATTGEFKDFIANYAKDRPIVKWEELDF